MRTFSVSFTEHTVTVPALAGYTAEGDETTEQHLYPYNLTSASYNFQWVEDESADVLLLYPDNFTLKVETNYLFNLTETGTSGSMSMDFSELSNVPTDMLLSLGSSSEVWNYLFDNGYTSAKGQGTWETSIICNEASSITDLGLNSFLDADLGNDWFLDVEYLYYSATVTEL